MNPKKKVNKLLYAAVACVRNYIPIVAKLLEVNAKVIATNSFDHTSLHFASWNGNPEVARLLLEELTLMPRLRVGKLPCIMHPRKVI